MWLVLQVCGCYCERAVLCGWYCWCVALYGWYFGCVVLCGWHCVSGTLASTVVGTVWLVLE